MGYGRSIVAVKWRPATSDARAREAGGQFPHPRPRLVGFSPLIAITTSDERTMNDIDYEHDLESSYVGLPLNPPASQNFVIGILDSGAVVDLVTGASAATLGLTGSYLTENVIGIGGVGGTVEAILSQPVGFFAVGLSGIRPDGTLDVDTLVGHSNVATLVAPPIICGNVEVIVAVVGTPFLAFYNTIIRVDTPRTVTVGGETITGPDVQIQDPLDPLPTDWRKIAIEFGGLSPVTTASYFPVFDPEDLITPLFPTQLSLSPISIPFGGVFFATIQVASGESGQQPMRVLVDTGAQSSIMSPAMAANLSLPLEPDFTVDVCGVGGIVEDVPGYYIDYVKINALGGALEFSRAPFVVLDLESPEGGPLDGVLGMNFFWNRNVVFEPSLTGSGFLSVSDPIPFAYGDFDLDFDVDADDVGTFLSCVTGSGVQALSPECTHIDSDDDGDLDLIDFGRIQLCFSGSGSSADPNCGS